jgi:hypothetical protein
MDSFLVMGAPMNSAKLLLDVEDLGIRFYDEHNATPIPGGVSYVLYLVDVLVGESCYRENVTSPLITNPILKQRNGYLGETPLNGENHLDLCKENSFFALR